ASDHNPFATTTVTFNPGDSFTIDGANRIYTKSVAVTLVDDRLVEKVENIRFKLDNLMTGGTDAIGFGGITTHRLDITENDFANVSVAAGTTTGTEGGASPNVQAQPTITT